MLPYQTYFLGRIKGWLETKGKVTLHHFGACPSALFAVHHSNVHKLEYSMTFRKYLEIVTNLSPNTQYTAIMRCM